jgi:ankyrin repeat protein
MLKCASSGDGYLKNLKEIFNTRDPDVNFVDSNGWTSLLLAVANGEEKTAEYLLQKAANPLLSTKHGASPLHFAAMYGNLSLCKLLIRYQADVNQLDMKCLTPLMLAAQYGHQAVVSELIHHGANLNTFDINKKTALDYAVEGRYGEICKILRKYSTK